jgi:hypothetical protein
VAKWRRVGKPFEFRTTGDGAEIDVGWSWRIERKGADHRFVRVEVALGSRYAEDLLAASRLAIATQGASAVDLVLDEETPPERIVVDSLGVRARAA